MQTNQRYKERVVNVIGGKIFSPDGTGYPEPIRAITIKEECYLWALGCRPSREFLGKGVTENED